MKRGKCCEEAYREGFDAAVNNWVNRVRAGFYTSGEVVSKTLTTDGGDYKFTWTTIGDSQSNISKDWKVKKIYKKRRRK